MKFRKHLFRLLGLLTTLIAILWIVGGLSGVDEEPAQSEAEEVGRAVGSGAAISVILCITVPLAMFFFIMSWRNAVGIRMEKRHQEQLEVMRSNRNDLPAAK